MARLPKENIYTTRCPQCGCLILLSGDELRERWEQEPTDNRGYSYKCPGCDGRVSYTTTELLMKSNGSELASVLDVDYDYYNFCHSRPLGHGVILDEGDRV